MKLAGAFPTVFFAMGIAAAVGAFQASAAPVSLAGVWSFDGTCASGDGMILKADGKASYDEWGEGLWALADKGTRIVIIAEDISEEADRRKVAELIEFRITASAGKRMSLMRLSDWFKIEAARCEPPR